MGVRAVSSSRVAIKGTGEGLVLALGQGELADLLAELEQELEDKAAFFRGGQIALRVGARELSFEEMEAFRELLARYHIRLEGVAKEAPRPQAAAHESDTEVAPAHQESLKGSPGLLFRGTLRSGQLLSSPGHLVIIGDVNPGADIVAGGDIVIWGKLRGTAHAGAEGDQRAVVCALQLMPIQLRIAGYIARSPGSGDQVPAGPEIAKLHDGVIVAEPWIGPKDDLLT
jgi:septum site-determining protein MinC